MARIKLSMTREQKDGAYKTFVLIDDRVVPFDGTNKAEIFVDTGKRHLNVIAYGPRGASATISVKRGGVDVVAPLACLISNDFGVAHATDDLELRA